MTQEFIYVGLSKGEFEGTKYDNLYLSNGIKTIKFKNKTGKSEFPFKEEVDKVIATLSINGDNKGNAVVTVVDLKSK